MAMVQEFIFGHGDVTILWLHGPGNTWKLPNTAALGEVNSVNSCFPTDLYQVLFLVSN